MANSHDLYNALISKFTPRLSEAIEKSIAQNEIVHVTLDGCDIGMVVGVALQISMDKSDDASKVNIDHVRENDGSFDLWSWVDGMAENEMSWRLNVTLVE